jgi:hypothetical protein
MKKYLLDVEFRYHDKPDNNGFGSYPNRTVTIGIYDTIEEAIEEGNKAIAILSKSFEVRSDDKFLLHGLFGCPKNLVTNCCYSTKGIQYFAHIKTLKFDNLEETIKECFDAFERYKQYKKEQSDED